MREFLCKIHEFRQDGLAQRNQFALKNYLLPAQKSCYSFNIDALKSFYDYLNVEYILTKRLSQEPIENPFGMIRSKAGANEHPNQIASIVNYGERGVHIG